MKIAICEDEKIYRDVIAKMILDFFQGTAYGDAEIFYFCDGTELLKSTERFDLILMDLIMKILHSILQKIVHVLNLIGKLINLDYLIDIMEISLMDLLELVHMIFQMHLKHIVLNYMN